MYLSATMLAQMRANVLMMLPDEAVIFTVSQTTSNGYTTNVQTAAGTVACRIDPVGGQSDELSYNLGRETISELYQLTVPHDAPLAAHNTVEINGNSYEIVQIDAGHSWNVSRRAVIQRTE